MDRSGTSIEELMRNGQNSNMSEDDDIVNSILNEINSEKDSTKVEMEQKQQQQIMEQQRMQQQQLAQQEMQKQRQMAQQQHMMMMQKQMEIERQQKEQKLDKSEEINICENISLLDEFKSSIIFFVIFMLLNLTQINNLICGALSIENNNIFILLKTFVATVIFFFVNKLVHKYI
jgi:hypothetical protein